MKAIDRLSRSHFREYQKLTQKKYRELEAKFLCEGVHLVEEALVARWPLEIVLITERILEHAGTGNLVERIREHAVPLAMCTEREMDALAGTVTNQGIVAVAVQRPSSGEFIPGIGSGGGIIVALDGISDPGNLGTTLRTCDWFGIGEVLIGGETVELFNPKVLRAGMGAHFHLHVSTVEDLPSQLSILKQQRTDVRIVVTALTGGAPPRRRTSDHPVIVVFGNEAHGVSPRIASLADEILTIPRLGKAESLNVAISCGVVLALAKYGA